MTHAVTASEPGGAISQNLCLLQIMPINIFTSITYKIKAKIYLFYLKLASNLYILFVSYDLSSQSCTIIFFSFVRSLLKCGFI